MINKTNNVIEPFPQAPQQRSTEESPSSDDRQALQYRETVDEQTEAESSSRLRKVVRGTGAVAAAGVTGLAATAALWNPEVRDSAPEVDNHVVQKQGTATIGGEKTGWTHGAAGRAIEHGLEKAGVSEEQISTLPLYTKTAEAVKEAGADGTVANPGDKFKVTVKVVKTPDGEISSVDVDNPEIVPSPRSQE